MHKIPKMIELKNWRTLIAQNLCIFNTHCIFEISLVLRNAHVVLKNQEKIVFYINNYINSD